MQLDAPLRELNRKGRWVRTLPCSALNRFIGNKPSIASATQIVSARVTPATDVAFVLVWNAKCEAIQFDAASFCEMKNVFVTIVQKSF